MDTTMESLDNLSVLFSARSWIVSNISFITFARPAPSRRQLEQSRDSEDLLHRPLFSPRGTGDKAYISNRHNLG
jgi:hypothetical protein